MFILTGNAPTVLGLELPPVCLSVQHIVQEEKSVLSVIMKKYVENIHVICRLQDLD